MLVRNLVTDSSSQPIRCTKKRIRGILIACIAAIFIVVLVIVTVYLTKGMYCPGLDPIMNGVTTSHVGVAHYRCNKGYSLYGGATRYCIYATLWSGIDPICYINNCTFPYTPIKAKRIDGHSEYHYGISVQYQCAEGHKMIGNSIRTCLYTGEWDHPATTCPAVSCEDPEQISNGHLDMFYNRRERRIYGDVVRYSCHIGYKLNGTRQRFCLSSGKWSGSLPVCTVVSCRRPAAPDNGSVAGTVFTYGQSVSYSCNPGYQLFGNKRRTCASSGDWSGTTPECTVRP